MGRRHLHDAPMCGTHPRAKRWISTDCCGWVCASLTWILLGFASFVVYVSLLEPWKGNIFSSDRSPSMSGWFHYIGFFGCILMAFWSHIKTMLTDPGAIPPDAVPLDYYNEPPHHGKFMSHHEICRACDSYKPRIAHHCSVCERCVIRMDHHCVWCNNCIGQTNHKFFILFVTYTFLACCWATYLIFAKMIACGRGYQKDVDGRFVQQLDFCDKSTVGDSLLNVLLGVEAFFFGLFTVCMMFDQVHVLQVGHSNIDKLKAKKAGEKLQSVTLQESLSHIFGGDGTFSLIWLIPVDAKWKNPEKEFKFMLPQRADALKFIGENGQNAVDNAGPRSSSHDERGDVEGSGEGQSENLGEHLA